MKLVWVVQRPGVSHDGDYGEPDWAGPPNIVCGFEDRDAARAYANALNDACGRVDPKTGTMTSPSRKRVRAMDPLRFLSRRNLYYTPMLPLYEVAVMPLLVASTALDAPGELHTKLAVLRDGAMEQNDKLLLMQLPSVDLDTVGWTSSGRTLMHYYNDPESPYAICGKAGAVWTDPPGSTRRKHCKSCTARLAELTLQPGARRRGDLR